MSRFKQLWLSFWRKDQGLGMIEAAITLPLFLMITFGVIEFGNMFMARYQSRDVASAVGDYLQGNPSASSADLQTFVTNLGFGSLKNTGPGEDNNVFTKIKIQSGKTMLTAAQFDALCSGGGVKNWANPWLGGDSADDKNDYYIHICYPYAYETITPLPELTVGAVPETKTMNNKALAYITKEMSCPDGQVLQSMTGGAATCVARDNNYSCASGQTLEKIVDGNPVCVAKDGNYTCAAGQVLKEVRPTGAVCESRDASYDCGAGKVLQKVQEGAAVCVSVSCYGDQVLQATSAGGAVCVDKDRGWYECPWGQFAYAIAYGVPYCAQVYNVPQPRMTLGPRFTPRNSWSDCTSEGADVVQVGIHEVDGGRGRGRLQAWCARLIFN
jgi:Flp pilus assembly protein TadG